MSGQASGGVHPPKGAGQQAKAHTITKEINSMHTQPPIQLPEQDQDGFSNNFPANLIPQDSYDDTYAMKQRNAVKNPYNGEPTQFVQEISKEDIDYQKRKQEVVNNLRYKQWLINTIDMTDPGSVALAREKGVLGDYYDEREKLIDYWHDVSARIAKMRLLGRSAWGPEDYKLAFAIKTGVLKLPTKSLMSPDAYMLGNNATQAKNRGFFNPHRMFKGWSSNFLRKTEDPFPELSGAAFPREGDKDHAPFARFGGLFNTQNDDYNSGAFNMAVAPPGMGNSFHM